MLTAQGSVVAKTATTISSTGIQGNCHLQAKVMATGASATSPAGSISFRNGNGNPAEVATAVLGPSLPGFALEPSYSTEAEGIHEVPQGLVTADFNGDGIPDLAEIYALFDQLIIRLGKGDGAFTTLAESPVIGSDPLSIIAADFNGDGKMDLAVGNEGNTLTVLLGEGDGAFTIASTPATGQGSFSLAAGDFNKTAIRISPCSTRTSR